MSRIFLLTALLSISASSILGQATAYQNGLWFDGRVFRSATFYVRENRLFTNRPSGKVEVVDLQGGYVIPPLADAHNHFPAGERTFASAVRANLEAGIFYILNPNDIAEDTEPLRARLDRSDSIDVIFAHGGFTCTGGHPEGLYKNLAKQGYVSFSENDLEGHAFWIADSTADADAKWQKFLNTKPDIVKLYLLDSGAYPRNIPGRRSEGLRAEVFRDLVRRAHAAGLRSAAHVETAADFELASDSGVDLMMHLPGYYKSDQIATDEYLLSDAAIRRAKERGVHVVTTAKLLENGASKEEFHGMRGIQITNLKRIKAARVPILVGSDGFAGIGTIAEVDYVRELGVFDSAELLRIWTEATPQSIYPNRKLGRLSDGYEASFLVLDGNPLTDWNALRRIRLRVKGGKSLSLPK